MANVMLTRRCTRSGWTTVKTFGDSTGDVRSEQRAGDDVAAVRRAGARRLRTMPTCASGTGAEMSRAMLRETTRERLS